MARKTSDLQEDGAPVLLNSAARRGRINSGFQELYKLKREKDRLDEEYLSEVKEEIKKVKRDLKADTDIDSKDLDLMFKIYEREQIAKTLMEDDDASRIQDNLREIFAALRHGQMLNFIDALEQAA